MSNGKGLKREKNTDDNVADGKATFPAEPFTPYILDMISKIRKEQINEHE